MGCCYGCCARLLRTAAAHGGWARLYVAGFGDGGLYYEWVMAILLEIECGGQQAEKCTEV